MNSPAKTTAKAHRAPAQSAKTIPFPGTQAANHPLTINDCLKPGAAADTLDKLIASWTKDEAVATQFAQDEIAKAITGGNSVGYQFWAGPYDAVWRVEVDTETTDADKKLLRDGVQKNLTGRNLSAPKDATFAQRLGKAVMGHSQLGKDRQRRSVVCIVLHDVATYHKVAPKDFVAFMQKNGWEKLRREARDRAKKASGVVNTWPDRLKELRDVLAVRSEDVIAVPASTTAMFDQHDEGKRALLIVTYKDGKLVVNGVTKPDNTLLERAVVSWAFQHKDHDFNATLPPAASDTEA